jgi:tRNA1(Val) A37 N6-methylase TrmN6
MNEERELDEVQRELENKYGSERVVREPVLGEGFSFRPDILVFEDEEHTTPLLILEYSSLSTPHRRNEDIEQVRRNLEATGASFGAVVSKDIRYIFRIDQNDELVEVPISGYPDIDDKPNNGPKPIGNYQMFQFLVERVRDQLREIHENRISGEFPQQLYREYEADRQQVSIDPENGFEEDIKRLDASIEQRHESYDPEAAPTDSPLLRTIFTVYSDYDLANTDLNIRHQIVEDTFMSDFFDKESAEFSTPPNVANILVELADISNDDTVLDPASGWGYTLRAANNHTDDVMGVEIHSGVNNASLFFNDLLEKSGEYLTGDFLKMSVNQSSQLPADADHIIMDPPMGAYAPEEVTEYLNEGKGVRVHEAFVSLALDRLSEGGRLTAVVPTSILAADRCAWLREKLLSDFTLRGVIEIGDSNEFTYLSANLAIIVVDKIREWGREFPGVVYDDSQESPNDLNQAARRIQNQEAELLQVDDPTESILPSELLGMRDAERDLSEQFDNLAAFDEFASEIAAGVHRPEEERHGNVPYLKLGADIDGPRTFVDSETPVATKTDVLIALKATPGKIYHPERRVVPSSNWAIVRFDSEEAAIVYATFLASDVSHQQIESMARGAAIQYVPLRRLSDVIVPTYSEKELSEKANKIQQIRRDQRVPEGEFDVDIDYKGVF